MFVMSIPLGDAAWCRVEVRLCAGAQSTPRIDARNRIAGVWEKLLGIAVIGTFNANRDGASIAKLQLRLTRPVQARIRLHACAVTGSLSYPHETQGSYGVADIGRDATGDFIGKWQGVTASELATSQSFLSDLCRLLGVDIPHATDEQDYMFERPIKFAHGDGNRSDGRIDLYRRGAFVLESKKLKAATHTKGFDDALLRARRQPDRRGGADVGPAARPPPAWHEVPPPASATAIHAGLLLQPVAAGR